MSMLKYMLAAAVLLAVAPSGRADMIPLSDRDMGSDGLGVFISDCPAELAQDGSVLFSTLDGVGLDRLPAGPLVDAQMAAEDADSPQRICILMDTQGSLGLCLYGLLGLGLCKAATFLFVCVIPVWCHDGGPCPIAHRLDLSPDGLHPVPMYCLVPPGCTTKDSLPRYRQEAIVVSWRDSQFTPIALAPRGPPRCSPVSRSYEQLCTMCG